MKSSWTILAGVGATTAALLCASNAGAQSTMQTTTQSTTGEQASTYSGPNRALLGAGAITLVASYTPAVVVAATSPRDEDKWLYVPVAGPWVDLGNRTSCESAGIPCSREDAYKALLIATGVVHAVGVGLVVASFLAPEKPTERVTATRVQITPAQLGRGGYGLAAVGTF